MLLAWASYTVHAAPFPGSRTTARTGAPGDGGPALDELRDTIRRQQSALADTGIALLVIRRNAAFAGYCGLTRGRATLAEPELAYELLRSYQGQGYATEAAQAVVDAAAATGRRRLWATVRPWNQASLRVLDKIGFAPTSRVTRDDSGELLWRDRPL